MGFSEVGTYLIFLALNIVIATCGAILLAFGAMLQVDEHQGVKSFAQLSIGGFAIGIGVLAFLIACSGCCALFRKRPFMLTYVAIIMVILFIVQIVLGAIALGTVNNSKCELDAEMKKSVETLFLRQDEAAAKAINHLQKTFRCCGVTGPSWWKQFSRPYPYPMSCCVGMEDPCEDPFEKGCADVYGAAIAKNVSVIGGVAIGFAIVELATAVMAWYLRLAFRKHEYV